MANSKKLAIYLGLIALYIYIWLDGGMIGHYIVICGAGTTAIFLVLQYLTRLSK